MTELSDRLKALQEAMTKGPWQHYDDTGPEGKNNRHEIVGWGKTVARIYATKGCEETDTANAAVIALGDLFIPLAMALEEALGTIVWMSGSSDFSPGGQAHEAWNRARNDYDRWSALLAQIAERLTGAGQ